MRELQTIRVGKGRGVGRPRVMYHRRSRAGSSQESRSTNGSVLEEDHIAYSFSLPFLVKDESFLDQ